MLAGQPFVIWGLPFPTLATLARISDILDLRELENLAYLSSLIKKEVNVTP